MKQQGAKIEQVSETTPSSPIPESTNVIAAREEADAKKINELRKQLKINTNLDHKSEHDTQANIAEVKGGDPNQQEVITAISKNVPEVGEKEEIQQQGFTGFEKWLQKVTDKQDKIGSGAQKRVFAHPESPEKIVSIFRFDQPVNEIKTRFYVNKILHILYPHNIPDIHLATSHPSALEVDRVMGKEISPWNLKQLFSKIAIERRLKKIGILIDGNSVNFIADQEGKVFYIDSFIGDFSWSKEKLLKTINQLESDEKQKALKYLARIEILNK